MELYLSLTVRLWSCEPIILALPLNRWWSRPSPRLQPVRGQGELDATDLGNAFDCTRVCVNLQPYDTRNEHIFIYIFVHYNSLLFLCQRRTLRNCLLPLCQRCSAPIWPLSSCSSKRWALTTCCGSAFSLWVARFESTEQLWCVHPLWKES